MAIQPPSDILLDVANAADPAQVRAASARLAKLAADPAAAADFNQALTTVAQQDQTPFAGPGPRVAIGAPTNRIDRAPKDAAAAYQKFEAVLLQKFVEAMLPKDDQLYGDKESAEVYRSMMAEQFANQIAKAGGIGIAKSMAAKHPPTAAHSGAVPGVEPSEA